MKCSNCGRTIKAVIKDEDTDECPDCGEALEEEESRHLLNK